MKITVEAGTYDEAIDELRKFLNENYAAYPNIARNVSIEFELYDSKNRICPDNEKEFKISDGKVTDHLNQEMAEAIETVKRKLGNEVKSLEDQVSAMTRHIKLDESYLAAKDEKGRKPENVEKRREELRQHRQKRKELQELLKDHYYVLHAVSERRYKGRSVTYKRHIPKNGKYEIHLDFDLPGFKGSYDIYQGLKRN